MPEKLKPCPFCGSKDIISRFRFGKNEFFGECVVVCCGCYTRQVSEIDLRDICFDKLIFSMERSVKQWNRRAENERRNHHN